MINKLEFNNMVITNKKKIQKVKTQTIQNLVQKIKKLKYILEKKPDNEKNRERFRKATLSLDELKKLKCVELMKRVLVLEKSPASIITNGLCPPEEVVVAMVAANKMMTELVNTFREKLGITDENQVWKTELMQTSKRRIKILRTEQKRKNRQDLKEQKEKARKRIEWLHSQNGTQGVESPIDKDEAKEFEVDEGANVSTLGYWKIEPIADERLNNFKKNNTINKNILPKKKNSVKKSSDIPNNRNILKSEAQDPHPTTTIKLSHSDDQDLATNSIDKPKILPSYIDANLETLNSLEAPKEIITHVEDPFFITASGESYRSSAVVVRNGKVLNSQTNETPANEPNRPVGKYAKHEYFQDFRVDNKRVVNKNLPRTVKENSTVALHPSWAAKQKYKPVIGSFQGKKIKFENDNNDGEVVMPQSKNILINKGNGRKNSLGTSNGIKVKTEDLHPSWVAKQKLKPTIAVFAGKKIIFEDVDNETSKPKEIVNVTGSTGKHVKSKATDALHPSWVAKQKLKPTITTFQGKKITFDDD